MSVTLSLIVGVPGHLNDTRDISSKIDARLSLMHNNPDPYRTPAQTLSKHAMVTPLRSGAMVGETGDMPVEGEEPSDDETEDEYVEEYESEEETEDADDSEDNDGYEDVYGIERHLREMAGQQPQMEMKHWAELQAARDVEDAADAARGPEYVRARRTAEVAYWNRIRKNALQCGVAGPGGGPA